MAKQKPKYTLFFELPKDRFEVEGATEFYAAMGRFAVRWNHLDANLGDLLRQIWDRPEAAHLNMSVPDSTTSKKDAWEKAFTELTFLQKRKNHGDAVSKSLGQLVHDRNVLLHGAFQGFTRSRPLTAQVIWYRERNTISKEIAHNITLDWIKRRISKINELNKHLHFVSMEMTYLFMADRVRHDLEEARRKRAASD